MKITHLYTYPIKSLRPAPVSSTALLTPQGFPYDRTFALLKIDPDSPNGLKNMHVPHFPEMTLFMTALEPPDPDKGNPTGSLTVTYCRIGNDEDKQQHQQQQQKLDNNDRDVLTMPLVPDITNLPEIEVNMHRSPTKAYKMPQEYNDWFSARFGFEVILAYLGGNRRKVLGSVNPNAETHRKNNNSKKKNSEESSWLSSISTTVSSAFTTTTTTNAKTSKVVEEEEEEEEEKPDPSITFADCAAYLICSLDSLNNVTSRLPPEHRPMDMTKFRPNIVVSSSSASSSASNSNNDDGAPWDEDFWAEIQFRPPRGPRIVLTSNCARCKSVNIDFATGKPGEGPVGEILKRLQSDRRVDPGARYSPIFGRYGFLVLDRREGKYYEEEDDDEESSFEIKIGDEVLVTKRNVEHTTFEWPGLGTPITRKEIQIQAN